MKLVLVALSVVFACVYGATNFEDWKARNGKNYEGSEESEEEARSAFNKTVAAIRKHNANQDATYQQGTNENSDMSEEKRQRRNGFKANHTHSNNVKSIENRVRGTSPASFNVTNLMGPIKNQGACGCCYEMSTLSMIDGVSKRNSTKYKTKAMTFSDQHVLDCDTYDGGCSGGNPLNVFRFAYETGLVQTSSYSALTLKKKTCVKTPPAWNLYNAAYGNLVKYGLEDTLKDIVYTYGPVVVAIDAKDPGLSSYKSGVYNPAPGKCSSDIAAANHAVVVTGYGTDPKTKLDYWIIRNSWGTTFGMGGYFWMKRGTNVCGVANQVWVVV